jgi:3-oxoacyl-[acyl-carrier protein] reductase/bacilysin biosynthesis oxidoreductase BacG
VDLHLHGKIALVTGGSSGIGLACARELADEGCDVALIARDRERLAAAAAELAVTGRKIVSIAADLSCGDEIKRAVFEATAALGQIDILVNSAGAARGGLFAEVDDAAFTEAWELKVLGYIRMTRAVIPGMIERRNGNIINIVGGSGRLPFVGFLTGSTANAALLNFTRGISKELAPHNVRINAVSPGITATERTQRLLEQLKDPAKSVDEARAEVSRSIPLGRQVLPSEIAAAVAFLVSDRSASTTGTELLVEGGVAPMI